jgi:glutathione S-transferase
MRLYVNAMSPYGRKVMVTIHEIGIADRVSIEDVNPRNEPQRVIPVSPMAKIPVLVADDGAIIKDSPVIAEYLDATFGGNRLLPASGAARWSALTLMADADGLIETAILFRNETLRPAGEQSPSFLEWQSGRVKRLMDQFEAVANDLGGRWDLGTIAAGAAISYVGRRLPAYENLAGYPRLAALRETFLQRPSFARTEPK